MTIQYRGLVKPEWLDYNGHMNLAYYVLAFDYATDEYYKKIGIAESYIKTDKCSMFTLEIDVTYQQELLLGEEFYIRTWLKEYNTKLVHYLHQMYHASNDELVATNECMAVHVDMQSRRSTAFPESKQSILQDFLESQDEKFAPKAIDSRLAIRK